MILPIEKDSKLLEQYGLAVALLASIEYLLGEFVRLNSGLALANQKTVNRLLADLTFGPLLGLASELIEDGTLASELDYINKERTWLAHAVSGMQGDEAVLMNQRKTSAARKEFNTEYLTTLIERARKAADGIVIQINRTHKLTAA